eukprot:gb/GECG01011053.1/.p1 GENE.gb/GECG01011053.1/~~gb/GECG01011053.1/.p1  ORF type:complete len:390 (+),score=71.69 gb/GECG01011053.1/:1-1170(+)
MISWDVPNSSQPTSTQSSGSTPRRSKKTKYSSRRVTAEDIQALYDEAVYSDTTSQQLNVAKKKPEALKGSSTQDRSNNAAIMEVIRNNYDENVMKEATKLFQNHFGRGQPRSSESANQGASASSPSRVSTQQSASSNRRQSNDNHRQSFGSPSGDQPVKRQQRRPAVKAEDPESSEDDTDDDSEDEMLGLTDKKPLFSGSTQQNKTSSQQQALRNHRAEFNEFANVASTGRNPGRSEDFRREYATQPDSGMSEALDHSFEAAKQSSLMESQENAQELEFESQGIVANAREQINKTDSQFRNQHISPLHNRQQANAKTIAGKPQSRKPWTKDETLKFLEGVREYGVGEWSIISSEKMNSSRNNVQLKDRFRTLLRKKIINDNGELIGDLD